MVNIIKKKWLFVKNRKFIIILSVIFIFALNEVLNYCKLWNINIFIISKKQYDFFYNLSVSYIVSFIFYLIINLYPELKKERELIPLRCMIYREVQLELCRIFDLFQNIMSYSEYTMTQYDNIDEYLEYNAIISGLHNLKISDKSGVFCNGIYGIAFKESIYMECNEVKKRGIRIIDTYISNMSNKLSYSIFYLVYECPIIHGYILTYETKEYHNIDECLYNCCTIYKDNLNKTIQKIIYIYNWTQEEYDFLKSHIEESDTIYPIDFKTYIPKVKRHNINQVI